MDWFPLYNSLRIALIASVIVFFTGIFAAYYIAKLHPVVKGVLDVVLTLPLVLPPTVVGYFLLRVMGTQKTAGRLASGNFGTKLVMTWYSGIFAASVVAFPLMYRTARGPLRASMRPTPIPDRPWAYLIALSSGGSGCPACRQGILAGAVLAFARALGEYGATSMVAGYTPAGPRPFPPPSISSGGQTTTPWPSGGFWSMWRSRRWCCWW